MEMDQLVTVYMQNTEVLESALSQVPESERWGLLHTIGIQLLTRFERTNSIDDLDWAITMEERAFEFTSNENPYHGAILNNLGSALQIRFKRTGSMADLDRAIEKSEQAVELTPVDHPSHAMYLSNLGNILQSRFERMGSMEDLDRAIEKNRKAVELTPAGYPGHAIHLNNLGNALQKRYERIGLMEDLDHAIKKREQAVESTPLNHPDLVKYLNNLGTILQRRFERIGLIEDLDRAIKKSEQAVELTPLNHPDLVNYLNNLGTILQRRFERMGLIEDLDRAIKKSEQAVELTPVDHPSHSMYLSNLGNILQRRFERTGLMEDIDRSIKKKEKGLELTPLDHPDRAGRLNTLGIALQSRFERTGSMENLDRAVDLLEQAVESTPVDHPNLARHLNNLGSTLQRRFERLGLMEDIDYAIQKKEQAVESTPVDHPDRAMYLSNLGNALQIRFERTGSMEDLDHSIEKNEQAVELIPIDHPSHAMFLNNLGNALQRRFKRMGSMEDIDRAIKKKEKAVELTTVDHPDYAGRLNNLGDALQTRFNRTGLIEDLDRAIEKVAQAVQSTPMDHPDRSGTLNNLAIALQSRFERTGVIEDLEGAIEKETQAVESTPVDHPNHALYLNNLGNTLQMRFERTGLMEDIDRAIKKKEKALELTPMDHPVRAGRLYNLGNALRSRFERTGSMEDFDRAIETKEEAAKSETAPPSIRLFAAQSCCNLLIRHGNHRRAKPILQAAVQILPRVSPRQLKRSDAQFNISQFANITSRAVSLLLADKDDACTSLQLLELGRGILANLQLEVRSDISILASFHPDLAHQFQELREKIDPPSRTIEFSVIEDPSTTFNSDPSKAISERRALLKQFDDLLVYIRSLPGLENFLQGPLETEMRSLAKNGAIVVFNMSDIRSDAFLITTNDIRSVHLPLLTSNLVRDLVKRFFEAINERHLSQYSYAMHKINSVLEGLWDYGVKPVLDNLGFTQMPAPEEAWPRVWWVGSGLLSVLPIHAAGYHDSNLLEAALDRVISSYASTVKSLSYAEERVAKADQVELNGNAILFAMPKTPEQKTLPFVEKEVRDIENLLLKASISTTVVMNPIREEALSKLPNHSIVHFACHGYSAVDPSQSSLLLQDWKSVPLTVSDLLSLNIMSAKLAYLSACHTSTMRDFNLLDESISLSSAIQLCGYPSVVGSLWQVGDIHSSNIARDVYVSILEGDCGLDVRRSAEGLHKAVRHLRDQSRFKGKQDPLIWAPFIHIGI